MVSSRFNGRIRQGRPETHLPAKVEGHIRYKVQAAEDIEHFVGITLENRSTRGSSPVHIPAENDCVVDDNHLAGAGKGVDVEINVISSGGYLAVGDHASGSSGPVGDVGPIAGAADPVVVGGKQ